VAAQRLGLDAAWLSKVPDSPVGRRVTSELRQHGVTVDAAESSDGRLGTYYLESGDLPRGNNVIYDRANAAVTTATPDELPTERVRDASAFHTTGITPGLSETLLETTGDLLSLAREAGTTTTFDLNYRSKVWAPEEARPAVETLFPDVDVLFTAQRDAEHVLGRDGDAEAIARGLQAEFDFDVTVVTRGSEGARGRRRRRVRTADVRSDGRPPCRHRRLVRRRFPVTVRRRRRRPGVARIRRGDDGGRQAVYPR